MYNDGRQNNQDKFLNVSNQTNSICMNCGVNYKHISVDADTMYVCVYIFERPIFSFSCLVFFISCSSGRVPKRFANARRAMHAKKAYIRHITLFYLGNDDDILRYFSRCIKLSVGAYRLAAASRRSCAFCAAKAPPTNGFGGFR